MATLQDAHAAGAVGGGCEGRPVCSGANPQVCAVRIQARIRDHGLQRRRCRGVARQPERREARRQGLVEVMDFLGRPIGLPFFLSKPKVVSSNLAQLNFLFSQIGAFLPCFGWINFFIQPKQ